MVAVLVIEDDDCVRLAIRCALEQGRGDEVFEARNGKEALGYLDAGLMPDAIMLDLRMPVMDGNAFLAAMRNREHAPIIVFSGYTTELDDEVAGIPVSIASKPLPMDRICALVTDALEPDSDLGGAP